MKKTITDRETKEVALDVINSGGGGGGSTSLKTFTFTGGGQITEDSEVNLPTDCNLILCIKGYGYIEGQEYSVLINALPLSKGSFTVRLTSYNEGTIEDGFDMYAIYSVENGKIHFVGTEQGNPLQYPITYTAYYL